VQTHDDNIDMSNEPDNLNEDAAMIDRETNYIGGGVFVSRVHEAKPLEEMNLHRVSGNRIIVANESSNCCHYPQLSSSRTYHRPSVAINWRQCVAQLTADFFVCILAIQIHTIDIFVKLSYRFGLMQMSRKSVGNCAVLIWPVNQL
jgi:hypothetical protein